MEDFIQNLRYRISTNSAVLTQDDPGFPAAHERWSDIDRKTPAVIVQPTSEHDVAILVEEAHAANIPFVPASGGHSTWSTVENGMIVDLSQYKEISVDPSQRTVAVRGGVLMKEMQLALSEKGQFTTVANGSTVGVIPYTIGGGVSSYGPLIGHACENILSARIVVASGDVVVASETHHKDLLWAIRGAGQFFGVVTELILRTYDLSLIGPNGERQLGLLYYPPERASEVCQVLKDVVCTNDHASAGHFMAMKDPSQGRLLMVAPQYFGTGPELQATFKPLIDMGPLQDMYLPSTFDKHSDHVDGMCSKGDFKRFSQTGLPSINPENFGKLVELHQELIETVPGTERSVFTIEWHTPAPSKGPRQTETAFGLKDIDIWLNILAWYTDPSLHEKVQEFDRRAQAIMRSGTKEDAFISHTNTSRDDPIEYRYNDPAAVRRLRELKQHWDADGCFTKEFLGDKRVPLPSL